MNKPRDRALAHLAAFLMCVGLIGSATAAEKASVSADGDLSRAAIFLHPTLDPRDSVGKDLVGKVQEQLGTSTKYRMVAQGEEAGLVVRMVTLNPNRGPQEASVYSETFTLAGHDGAPETFLMSTVAVCPVGQTATCAQGVIHDLDEVLDQFLRAVRRAAEQQHKSVRLGTDVFDV